MENYEPIFKITPEILTTVYGIAADLARIDIIRERALTPELRKENRIKTIHSSLWIEANSLTLEQVTDIMNGKKVVGPAKDIREAKNAIAAYDALLDCDPYSEKDLLRQQGLLMKGLVDNAGRYRNAGVGVFAGKVPVHVAPPHKQVPVLMGRLLDWVKTAKLPQVVKSCIFHYEFEFIHPFMDGNGRMGRMWQTLLLYQENPVFAWLPVETIVARHQQEYYRAIRQSTHHTDSGIFAAFMLSALKQATAELKVKYDRGEMEGGKRVGANAGVNAGVNAGANEGVKLTVTQHKILSLIEKDAVVSQAEIARIMKVYETTVYRNIEKLKSLGIITREGSDKTGRWVILRSEVRGKR